MKHLLPLALGLLLTGCASFQEAYLLDREFGQNSGAAWQQQVAVPVPDRADSVPVGMEGITAEEIMHVYNRTFAEAPQPQNIISFGLPTP